MLWDGRGGCSCSTYSLAHEKNSECGTGEVLGVGGEVGSQHHIGPNQPTLADSHLFQ